MSYCYPCHGHEGVAWANTKIAGRARTDKIFVYNMIQQLPIETFKSTYKAAFKKLDDKKPPILDRLNPFKCAMCLDNVHQKMSVKTKHVFFQFKLKQTYRCSVDDSPSPCTKKKA